MPTIRMECHNDEKNQHKYWQVTTEYNGKPNSMLVAYGRLPGYGRRATTTYRVMPYRAWWIENKMKEKFRKGYTQIGDESVFVDDTELKSDKLESVGLTESEVMGFAKRLSRIL